MSQLSFKCAYSFWLVFRLFVMSWIMTMFTTQQDYLGFLLWQCLSVLPALGFLGVVYHANRPYWLIVLSFVVMVYWGLSASRWLIAWYEQQANILIWAYAFESVLLTVVLVALFVLLKKLPPMHKQQTPKA